jgi:4-hydroxybenzoyl-CoA reductase subunit alpha
MTEEYSVVGKAVVPDLSAKARGSALYTSDMKIPGMLCGRILRSRLPHVKILNIDVRRAKKLSGVKAVITGKEA